jgi:hypothetical protein
MKNRETPEDDWAQFIYKKRPDDGGAPFSQRLTKQRNGGAN